jgi:hypothetical protein
MPRIAPLVPVAAVAALAVASAAEARTLTLRPGEGFTVAGTKLVCTYGGKAGTSGGLGCRTQSSSGPIVNSYSIGFGPASMGVSRFTAPTKASSVLAKQQPGAPKAAAFKQDYFSIRMIASLRQGDVVKLGGTAVRCGVARGAAFPGILGIRCALVSGANVLAGTYEAGVDDSGAIVWRNKKLVVQKRHGA